MEPQIGTQFIKNRDWVADAILERFGTPNAQKPADVWTPFGAHFRPKSEKGCPKRHPKIDAEKVSEIDAELVQK